MTQKFKKSNALYHILKESQLMEEADAVKESVGESFEIHLFDFDGTLFRSPLPPPLWKGGWWSNSASLNPPCVPERPGDEWWILDTLSDARSSTSSSNIFTVLLTGRQENIYGQRVRDLIAQAGLMFDYVELSDSYETKEFKSKRIKDLLERYPLTSKLKIWDDRVGHMEYYKGVAISVNPNIEVETKLVSTYPMPAACEAEDGTLPAEIPSRAGYIGLMLDSTSKSELLKAFGPKLDNVFADHVTLIFSPKKNSFESLWDYMGKPYSIVVTGYAEDSNCQAVTVDMPDLDSEIMEVVNSELSKKGMLDKKFHITIATSEGTPAKYSNDLLSKSELKKSPSLNLSGILWWK